MPPHNYYGDGSFSYHNHYYSLHALPPSSPSQSTPPLPQPQRPRSPRTHAIRSYSAPRPPTIEERVPSEKWAFASPSCHLIADKLDALHGEGGLEWFLRAAEYAEDRAGASAAAHQTHWSMWFEVQCARMWNHHRGLKNAVDRFGYRCWYESRGGASEEEEEMSDGGRGMAEWLAQNAEARGRGGWKHVRFQRGGEMESERGWRRSRSSGDAERMHPIERLLRKTWGWREEEPLIRMRGGRGGEKASVRRKKGGGQGKSKSKSSRPLEGRGKVNDVEWKDVRRTYENGTKTDRWVRCL